MMQIQEVLSEGLTHHQRRKVSPQLHVATKHLKECEASKLIKTRSLCLSLEKRSQHLGADGIYLDDITELEPEVAALYFPKRSICLFPCGSMQEPNRIWHSVLMLLLSDGSSSSAKGDSEMMMMMGVRSGNQSPQSVASSGMDSGVDSLPEQLGDLPQVAISLCGGLADTGEITRGRQRRRMVSY